MLVPYIDQYGDMKTVQWEISDVGGGNDSLPTKASRKMLQAEQIITKWAPALLQMCLDDILWKDSNDISVKKLWDYLTTYCYLPRLSSYSVLEETICQGVASTEYFALAAAFNGERYIDLKFNKSVFSINPSDLLVKIDVAKKQIEAERKADEERNNEGSGQPSSWDVAGGSGSSSTGGYSPSGNGTSTVEEGTNEVGLDAVPKNKHFYMSVKLDNTRVNRDMNNYVQEIIQHLMSIDGADVEMKLEVQVQAPNGIPSTTVRTVSENCKTLKVDDFGFDD